LCHPDSFSSFANPYPKRVGDDSDCAASLCHQGYNSRSLELSGRKSSHDGPQAKNPARKRPLAQASAKPSQEAGDRLKHSLADHEPIIFPNRRKAIRKGSGLIVRGQMFYVKWKVPKALQKIVGKTHFVRSLRTGRLNEAVRMNGSYGKEFSKWYSRYMRKIGVQQSGDKTCYHSHRHRWRDALRNAKIDHEVSLALGGWTGPNKGEVHANYGRGHSITDLSEALNKLNFEVISRI
jgi:hypothetical protein